MPKFSIAQRIAGIFFLILLCSVVLLNMRFNAMVSVARWETGPCSGTNSMYRKVKLFGRQTHVFLGEESDDLPNLSMYQIGRIEEGFVVIEKPQLSGNVDFGTILESPVIQYRNPRTCETWIKETGVDFRPKKPEKKLYVSPTEVFSF
jgi:hypothetical protein